jgi:xanthine dehydrogenase accessory factor
MKTVALLLAAGAARRMGRLKQLLPWQGRPMLQHALDHLLDSRVDSVVLVLGCEGERVLQNLSLSAGDRVRVVHNPDWRTGMASSLVCGLQAAPDAEAVLVALGDLPAIPPGVVDLLIEEAAQGGCTVVAPVYEGRRGHPVLFGRTHFDQLRALEGDSGGAGILRAHPGQVRLVPVDSSGILHDVDRLGDLFRLAGHEDLPLVVLRGGGDLASGVAHRLFVSGFPVLILELPQPRMVRRTVSFAEALYRGQVRIEGVSARRVEEPLACPGEIPVLVDPEAETLEELEPGVLVDARMLKANRGTCRGQAPVVVGLGPGFQAGQDVDFVVETQRGHDLGRVLLEGMARPDTGIPGILGGEGTRRVVRAPQAGLFRSEREIGELVRQGDRLGRVGSLPVLSSLDGLLRGLLHDGLEVRSGEKIADVDPRGDQVDVHTLSDKSRAVGGGVLEAVMRGLFGHKAFADGVGRSVLE